MKVLYIDLNIHYINPTRNLIPSLLKLIGKTYFFGPGYQPEQILKRRISSFYDRYGPFDFVITNEYVIFSTLSSDFSLLLNAYKRNYFFQFDSSLLKDFFKKAFYFFASYSGNKVIFMLASDYYNFRKKQIEIIEKLDSYIIGFGENLISSIKELKNINKESFYYLCNDNWYNFVKNNNRVIELPHFVGEHEFYFNCLKDRHYDFAVPGVEYFFRRKVKHILSEQKNVKVYKNALWMKLYSLGRKLGLKPDASPSLIGLYNSLFRTQLRRTKFVVTCGSALNWPLRKFFEIPASGALLIAKPFKNAQHLGFVDKKTYLKVELNSILDIIEWVSKNEEESQKIATDGQNMVWELHSIHARSSQLKKVLQRIKEKKFNKCYWKEGEFIVE